MDKRKNNGGHSTKGKAGRPSKAEELGLHNIMDSLLPTNDVLKEFAGIISNTEDEKLKFSAIVKWLEWRVGKPKETLDLTQKGKLDINMPTIIFK
tara:strand:+ start:684 stop:968 length:285 start_codon:yes stop_codon:yes gene_type:complete